MLLAVGSCNAIENKKAELFQHKFNRWVGAQDYPDGIGGNLLSCKRYYVYVVYHGSAKKGNPFKSWRRFIL